MNAIDDQKVPCYMSVHFHALLTQHLGMRCYRTEEKYKFECADGRFAHTWLNIWGKWIIKHNIRSDIRHSDWEESDFCERNWTSVQRDFRLTGMGMMTSDLNSFCGFMQKHFDPSENILVYPKKRQLVLF